MIGIVFGLLQGSAWPSVLWRASVATFCAGMLMRWWGRIWVHSLELHYNEKQASVTKLESAPSFAARAKS